MKSKRLTKKRIEKLLKAARPGAIELLQRASKLYEQQRGPSPKLKRQ